MMKCITRRKEATILFALAGIYFTISWGLFWKIHTIDPERPLAEDSSRYEYLARSIIGGKGFTLEGNIETYRTPGYPLYIAAFYKLFGTSRLLFMTTQILLSTGTILLLYVVTKRVWQKPSLSLIAAILLALDVEGFNIAHHVMSDTLFTFLFTLSVFFTVSFLTNKQKNILIVFLIGFFLALATIVRPISYYLTFLLLFCLLLYGFISHWEWKKVILACFLLTLPSAVFIGGWQFHNFYKSGNPQLSTVEASNVFYLKAVRIVALRDKISGREAEKKLFAFIPNRTELTEAEYYKYLMKISIPLIIKNPLLLLRVKLHDFKYMILAPGVESFFRYLGTPTGGGAIGDLKRLSYDAYVKKWIYDIPLQFAIYLFAAGSLALLYMSSIIGLLVILEKQPKELIFVHTLIWGLILYFILVSEGATRMRLPFIPLLSIYGALGTTRLFTGLTFSVKHFIIPLCHRLKKF